MQQATRSQSVSLNTERGELFSVLLRLHPVEAGWVSPSSGSQAHAAFLDIYTTMILCWPNNCTSQTSDDHLREVFCKD